MTQILQQMMEIEKCSQDTKILRKSGIIDGKTESCFWDPFVFLGRSKRMTDAVSK